MNLDYLSNKLKYISLIMISSFYLSYGQSNENKRLDVVRRYLEAVKNWDGEEVRRLSTRERIKNVKFDSQEFDLIDSVLALEDYNDLEKFLFNKNLPELVWIKHRDYRHCIFLKEEDGELKIHTISELHTFEESVTIEDLNKE